MSWLGFENGDTALVNGARLELDFGGGTPPPVSGVDYYIAADGSALNTGLDPASCWPLDHALQLCGPGDTLHLRDTGGKYRAPAGWTLARSGINGSPIRITPYLNEVPIIDGAEPDPVDNPAGAWVLHDLAKNIWKTVATYPPGQFAYYTGFIALGASADDRDEWYPLVDYKNYSYFESDVHTWSADPFYMGPGVYFDNVNGGPIFVRLVNSTAEAQCNRNVTQITDPDPRNHWIHLSRFNVFGFTVAGQWVEFDGDPQFDADGIVPGTGLIIQNYYSLFGIGAAPGASDHFRAVNVEGHTNYFVIRPGYATDWKILGGYYDGHLDPERWWISWIDVKGSEASPSLTKLPADHMRKCFADLGSSVSYEIGPSPNTGNGTAFFPSPGGALPLKVKGFFDAMLGLGSGTPTAHAKVHGVLFDTIWDDTTQVYGTQHHTDMYDFKCLGAGPGRDGAYTSTPNPAPGTYWIYDGLVVGKRIFWYRKGRPEDPTGIGWRETGCMQNHGSPNDAAHHTNPFKMWNVTLVVGLTGYGVSAGNGKNPLGVGRMGSNLATIEAAEERYNCILYIVNGLPLGRDAWTADGGEIYDGNLYWGWGIGAPSGYTSAWRFLHTSSGDISGESPLASMDTPAEIRAYAVTDSQAYYAPGWEAAGVHLDPLFDADWVPQAAGVHTGAVDVAALHPTWPGLVGYVPHRGAAS